MVLVFAEQQEGQFKKAAHEAITYGVKTAAAMGTSCQALVLGKNDSAATLGQYGVEKVHVVEGDAFGDFDSQTFASAISNAASQLGASLVVLSHSFIGKAITGRIAVRLEAGSVSGANRVPVVQGDKLHVGKSVFSGKAEVTYSLSAEKAVISVMGNSIKPEKSGSDCPIESINVEFTPPGVKVTKTRRAEGRVPLPEAERVVSAGRGMKDASNWGIIEELAEELGATTACSRPVADTGWRPHHEHVGQTGIAIRPNLYIAIGISGAIQHLAGVNNSKVIVVINKDPEAPFFKAADYGVVGDLFEVVPRLTESVRKFKSGQA